MTLTRTRLLALLALAPLTESVSQLVLTVLVVDTALFLTLLVRAGVRSRPDPGTGTALADVEDRVVGPQ